MASPMRTAELNTAAAPQPARSFSDPAVRPLAAMPATDPVQNQPAAELSLPSAGRRWAAMLPAWLQTHRLAPQAAVHHAATFTSSPRLRQRLVELFDLRQEARATPYPLLHAQGVVVLLQTRVLADLGVNRRHVRHFRHHTRLPLGARALGDAARQRLDCQLLRVVRVSPSEVMALLQTRITDDEGQLLALLEDGYVVGELSPTDALRADDDDLLRRAVSRDRRREPVIDPADEGVLRRQLLMAGQTRRRLGRVSGMRGLFLEGPSRWPGRPHPAVQALYVRNLVARELAEWGVEPTALQMTFCAPARMGQTLCLRLLGRAFELVGPDGQLMAFGNVA